jgi:2-polyprenyl-3-methyl-5-hydroxy-6-metoxy-1,4-benzoquinol methylase
MDMRQAKEILGTHFSVIAEDVAPIIDTLQLPTDASILDVGTGMGYLSIILALHGYKVLTGEPDSDTSVHAKRDWLTNAQKVQVDQLITFRSFDAEALPFADHSFDAIFFLGVLHHIEEPLRIRVLQDSFRTSRPNGVVCFFEPNLQGIEMARKHDPSHPEAADPSIYSPELDWSVHKDHGNFFDIFVFQKAQGEQRA